MTTMTIIWKTLTKKHNFKIWFYSEIYKEISMSRNLIKPFLLFIIILLLTQSIMAQQPDSDKNIKQTNKSETKADSDSNSNKNWLGLAIAFGGPAAIIGVGATQWWMDHKLVVSADNFVLRDRGWFGRNTYSGGHDKIGHFYSNYVFQYAFTSGFEYAGFGRATSIWMSAGVTFFGFNLIEVFDSFTDYGWEFGDSVANVLGQGLAILGQFYGIDHYIQMRLAWIPSRSYMNKEMKQYQFLEDYNGQRFFLLMNTYGFAKKFQWNIGVLKYIAPGLYYESRGYRPELPDDRTNERQRNLGGALVLDFAAISKDLGPKSSFWRTMATIFRFYQPSIFIGWGYDFNNQRWHRPDMSLQFTARFQ